MRTVPRDPRSLYRQRIEALYKQYRRGRLQNVNELYEKITGILPVKTEKEARDLASEAEEVFGRCYQIYPCEDCGNFIFEGDSYVDENNGDGFYCYECYDNYHRLRRDNDDEDDEY